VAANRVLNLLHQWMDPRYLQVRGFGPPTSDERSRPLFWRYWRALPRRGQVGVFVRGWSQRVLERRLYKKIGDKKMTRWTAHIRAHERQLALDGMSIAKFWLHLERKEYRQEVKILSKQPLLALRPSAKRLAVLGDYDRVHRIAGKLLEGTHTEIAPWNLVDATDARHCDLTVMRAIRDVLANAESDRVQAKDTPTPRTEPPSASDSPLAATDLSCRLDKQEYNKRLERERARLTRRVYRAFKNQRPVVLIFEGWDAAGKGGVIRRVAAAMDASLYRIVPIAAPTDEERGYHYLWRFWRHVPPDGHVTIFDRSWYGRVLVERVESLATPEEWGRAYDEINDFEQQLVEHGAVVQKFWLHIDPDEQLRRFREREESPVKQYKITDEDYRNRERWSDYAKAVDEMVLRTSKPDAPWHVVPANDKRWARVEVFDKICKALSDAGGAHD